MLQHKQKVTVKVSYLIEVVKKQRAQWLAEIKTINNHRTQILKEWKAWDVKVLTLVKSGKLKVEFGSLVEKGVGATIVGKLPATPKEPRRPLVDIKAEDDGYFGSDVHCSSDPSLRWARRLRDFDRKLNLLSNMEEETLTFKLNQDNLSFVDDEWSDFFN